MELESCLSRVSSLRLKLKCGKRHWLKNNCNRQTEGQTDNYNPCACAEGTILLRLSGKTHCCGWSLTVAAAV